ncbi:MAG: hypothetical protein EXR71_11525 [Myxococcales bacterium]|nr:hypothetical protein [Myxococcales bacterium]
MTFIGWLALAACRGPTAGELRTDLEGLAARTQLPAAVTNARWMTESGQVGRSASGRADARVYAWVRTDGSAEGWLTATLGPPIGERLHRVKDRVAEVLFTPELKRVLARDERKKSWKLACLKYPAHAIGKGEYRGDTVLGCDDHLYLALGAR